MIITKFGDKVLGEAQDIYVVQVLIEYKQQQQQLKRLIKMSFIELTNQQNKQTRRKDRKRANETNERTNERTNTDAVSPSELSIAFCLLLLHQTDTSVCP